MRFKTIQEILGPELVAKIKADSTEASHLTQNAGVHPDIVLFHKWAHRIPKEWTGFNLGAATSLNWARAINLYLDYVNKFAKNFTINYIYVDTWMPTLPGRRKMPVRLIAGKCRIIMYFNMDAARPTTAKKEKALIGIWNALQDLLVYDTSKK